MAITIEQIRSSAPGYADMSDDAIYNYLKSNGVDTNLISGYKPPEQTPFMNTVRSTGATMLNAFAGQPVEDIGNAAGIEPLQNFGRGIRQYAEGVNRDNPTNINSMSDVIAHPIDATKVALGNVLPQIPVSLASAYAGAEGGAALGGLLGPAGAAVGGTIGGLAGAFAPSYLQEYQAMREKQLENGQEDIGKALKYAVPAAALDTVGDVFMANKLMPKAVRGVLGKALGESVLSTTGNRAAHVAQEAVKGFAAEAGQEYAQTGLEQMGGNQPLNTDEASQERMVSGVLGGIGGGAIRGGLSSFDARQPTGPLDKALQAGGLNTQQQANNNDRTNTGNATETGSNGERPDVYTGADTGTTGSNKGLGSAIGGLNQPFIPTHITQGGVPVRQVKGSLFVDERGNRIERPLSVMTEIRNEREINPNWQQDNQENAQDVKSPIQTESTQPGITPAQGLSQTQGNISQPQEVNNNGKSTQESTRETLQTGQEGLLNTETKINPIIENGVINSEKTVKTFPNIPEGHTRLYRASSPTVKFDDVFDKSKLLKFKPKKEGEFYTTDLNYADYFRSTYGKDASINYIDIPNEKLKGQQVGENEYILPNQDEPKEHLKPTHITSDGVPVIATDTPNVWFDGQQEIEDNYAQPIREVRNESNSRGTTENVPGTPRGLQGTGSGESGIAGNATAGLGGNGEQLSNQRTGGNDSGQSVSSSAVDRTSLKQELLNRGIPETHVTALFDTFDKNPTLDKQGIARGVLGRTELFPLTKGIDFNKEYQASESTEKLNNSDLRTRERSRGTNIDDAGLQASNKTEKGNEWETYYHQLRGANANPDPVSGVSYAVANAVYKRKSNENDGYEYRLVPHPQFDTYKVERKKIEAVQKKSKKIVPTYKEQKESTYGADQIQLDNAPKIDKFGKEGESFEDQIERIKREQKEMLKRLEDKVNENEATNEKTEIPIQPSTDIPATKPTATDSEQKRVDRPVRVQSSESGDVKQHWEMTQDEFTDDYWSKNPAPKFVDAGDYYLEDYLKHHRAASEIAIKQDLSKYGNPDKKIPEYGETYFDTVQKAREWHKVNPVPNHKDMVFKALQEGKPVPKQVLSDYPDLKQTENVKPEPAKANKKPSSTNSGQVTKESEEGRVNSNNNIKGKVGDKFSYGDTPLTSSGRKTTPFPKAFTKDGKTTKTHLMLVDKWLMKNALEEAKSRGDTFNARQFESQQVKPSQADKDAAEEYLFGQQPEVQKPFLKPLVKKEESKPEEKPTYESTQRKTTDRRNREWTKELAAEYHQAVIALEGANATLAMNDPNTVHHENRVAGSVVILAKHLGLDKDQIVRATVSALGHDLGKRGMKDLIEKHEPLNPDEINIIRTHPQLVRPILKELGISENIIQAAEEHHDKDPKEFSGKIVKVADIGDSLIGGKDSGHNYPLRFKGQELPRTVESIIKIMDSMAQEGEINQEVYAAYKEMLMKGEIPNAQKAELERNGDVPWPIVEHNKLLNKEPKETEETQDPRKETYQKLYGISKRLGLVVDSGVMHFKSGGGAIRIPADDKFATGADVNTIFSHELGHAVMQKRGISYQSFPVAELKKQIPNWNELVKASKEFRPSIWNHSSKKISDHARKPDEIIADSIASVLLGKNDFSLLSGLPLEKHDLGYQEPVVKENKVTETPSKEPLQVENKQGESGVKFSKGEQNNGSTVEEVTQRISKDFKGLLSTGKVKVITASEAVKIDKGAADAQAFYNPADDTSYFVADNLNEFADLDALMQHEVGVHAMQLGKDDAEFKAILKQVEAMLEGGNKQVKAAFDRVPKDTKAHLIIEETSAYLVQLHPNLSISQRIVAWFKSAIRRLGKAMPPLERMAFFRWANKLQPTDLKYMAQSALKSASSDLMFDGHVKGGIKFHAAFHGTPHDFEKFSLDHIGEGEGAQAFGHGLYFTDDEGIAKFYRNKLSKHTSNIGFLGRSKTITVKDFKSLDGIHAFKGIITVNDAINSLDSMLKVAKINPEIYSKADIKYAKEDIELLRMIEKSGGINFNGKLYQVELAPEQDEYLDWDKPLSEQSDKVFNKIKEAITSKFSHDIQEKIISKIEYLSVNENSIQDYRSGSGEDFYQALSENIGGDKAASDFLHSIGIRGIRYKAEGGKSDANNYVIFSDDDVSITAKFSKAPPVKSSLWNRWFGQSKMKRGGEPIKFYHGSNADFNVFDKSKLGTATNHPTAGLGFFFTENKDEASNYGGQVKEVYLAINKPYVTTSELLDKAMGNDIAKFVDKLKSQGYDGLYIRNAKYAVAFNSNQAKLTSNQSPTFVNDVRYSMKDKYAVKQKKLNVTHISKNLKNVPIHLVEYNGKPYINIDENGNVEFFTYIGSLSSSELSNMADFALQEFFSPLKNNQYVRVSVSKDDYEHLINKTHRGSLNWITRENENGLSVAKIPYPVDGGKYAYIVSGEKIGEGSDGEPLLDINTVKPESKPIPVQKFRESFNLKKIKNLKNIGISEDDYRALVSSGRVTKDKKPEILNNTSNQSPSFGDDVRYSKAPQWAKDLADKATESIQDHITTSKTFNAINNSVNTQAYKAWKDKDYKPVFDESIAYEQDMARIANENADKAPSMLPKLEGLIESIKEVKQGYKRMEDAKAIGKAIFDTTQENQKRMTQADLKREGYTDSQIKMYNEFFDAVNASLDDLGKSELFRAAKALKLMPASQNLTLRQAANYYVQQIEDKPADFFDEEAEKLAKEFTDKADRIQELQNQGYAPFQRFGQYTLNVQEEGSKDSEYFGMYEDEAEANKDYRIMQELYPNAKVTKGIMSQDDWQMFKGVTPETMETFAKLMGIDQEKAFQEYLKIGINNRSALKRLIHRKGTQGYSIDPQRVLATFLTSNARMASKNLHMGEMLDAISRIPKEKGDVKDEAVALYNYVQNPSAAGAAVRGALFTWYLGGSIASAAVNLSQSFTTTYPALHQIGNAKQVVFQLGRAMKLAMNQHKLTGDLAAALKRAEEEGVTAPQELHMLYGESMRTGFAGAIKPLRPVMKLWGSFFSLAEAYNRRVAFIAAYNLAKMNGKPDPFKVAEQIVNDTQFQYVKSARPNWARSTVGSTVFTFKTFTINYLEFLKKMPVKERSIALAVLLLMAGAAGAPGADDLDDMIDTVGQSLGYNTNAKGWKEQHISKYILYGMSSVLPIDISSRLGVGNILPGTAMFKRSETNKTKDAMEFVGPAGSLAQKIIDAFDTASGRQGIGSWIDAATDVALPVALSNLAKAYDMAETGMYRDYKGGKVVDVSTGDIISKGFGFQPSSVAEARRPERIYQQDRTLTTKTEGEIASLWARGVFEKDRSKVEEAKSLLKDWNEKNPDTPIRINMKQVFRRVKEMRTPSDQRLIKSSPPELRKYAKDMLK